MTAREHNFEMLRAVPLEVTARVGTTHLSVEQILALGEGAVVELDRAATEPIDVLVGGAVVARGEIVAAGESFGVRISEIVSPKR